MNKFLKVLFPFYRTERHGFLFDKWWFRLIVIVYPLAILMILSWYFNDQLSIYTACYDMANIFFEWGTPDYLSEFEKCRAGVRGALLPSIGASILITTIIHYLSQLIFFKAFIYVIYGKKK